jgi:branched-chain amino acid transport system ATP-binding protein
VFENLRCAVLWSLGYRYSFWHRLSRLRDANERAESLLQMLRLERRRDTLARTSRTPSSVHSRSA